MTASPLETIVGCSFKTRCPYAEPVCDRMETRLKDTGVRGVFLILIRCFPCGLSMAPDDPGTVQKVPL